uniref:Uncharacterized protein n=1 Tax=Candidatus Kentrum sp. LFY TaxID=2126342 RepID=A0A450U7T7_9GAMM|nr:MAG: hypothetical protein BECKLFY1418B_GA0070995_100840 [Candidatus Kentron sp. LFY]
MCHKDIVRDAVQQGAIGICYAFATQGRPLRRGRFLFYRRKHAGEASLDALSGKTPFPSVDSPPINFPASFTDKQPLPPNAPRETTGRPLPLQDPIHFPVISQSPMILKQRTEMRRVDAATKSETLGVGHQTIQPLTWPGRNRLIVLRPRQSSHTPKIFPLVEMTDVGGDKIFRSSGFRILAYFPLSFADESSFTKRKFCFTNA